MSLSLCLLLSVCLFLSVCLITMDFSLSNVDLLRCKVDKLDCSLKRFRFDRLKNTPLLVSL